MKEVLGSLGVLLIFLAFSFDEKKILSASLAFAGFAMMLISFIMIRKAQKRQ